MAAKSNQGSTVPEMGEAVSPELEAADDAIIPVATAVGDTTPGEWAAFGVQAMDKTAWMSLQKVLHRLLTTKVADGNAEDDNEDDESETAVPSGSNSSRLRDLEKLIIEWRSSWQREHNKEVEELQSRCRDLEEQLEERTTSEELLTVELSAMRQQGVDWRQAAVSSEVQKVKSRLKQIESAKDSAEQVSILYVQPLCPLQIL